MANTSVEERSFLYRGLDNGARLNLLGPLGLRCYPIMDWLTTNYASVDSFRKQVTFRQLGVPEVVFSGK